MKLRRRSSKERWKEKWLRKSRGKKTSQRVMLVSSLVFLRSGKGPYVSRDLMLGWFRLLQVCSFRAWTLGLKITAIHFDLRETRNNSKIRMLGQVLYSMYRSKKANFGRCQTVSDHDLCIGELVMFAEHSVHKSHTSAPPPPPSHVYWDQRVLKYLYFIDDPTFSPSMIRPPPPPGAAKAGKNNLNN